MAGFHATPADDGLRQMFGEGTHPQMELFEGKLAPWMDEPGPPPRVPASLPAHPPPGSGPNDGAAG